MKCLVIVNKNSGKGQILRYKDYIISNFQEKFGETTWIETEYRGHATILAKEYGEICDYLVVAGGDGTLNEVINGLLQNGKQPILAQIPSGTVNDFASTLGMSKNIKKSVKQIISSKPKEFDIFESNGKYGIYICGFGVFTKTSYTASQKKKNKFGVLSYFFNGLKEIKTFAPQSIEIEFNDEKLNRKVAIVLVINSESVGGFKFNKNAKLSDKRMDFIAISAKKDKICFSDLLIIAKLFLFGIKSISKNKRVIYREITDFKIKSNENILINFDGELIGEKKEFSLQVSNKALKFLTTQKD